MPTKGKHLSEETKRKVSKNHADVSGENNPMFGKIPWNKGQHCSLETRTKISTSLMGNVPWNKGIHGCFSEETLKQMSDSHIGKHLSEHGKMLVSAFQKGRHRSAETCQRISAGLVGKKQSDEHRRKNSEGHKGQVSPNKGIPCPIERRKRISETLKGRFVGELNPAWKGGLSFEEYGIEFDAVLKMKIHSRDFYTCQLCGGNGSNNGRLPDVHHIDYDKKNNNPWNLITLCMMCHDLTNGKRKYWTLFFKNFRWIESSKFRIKR